jgi:hypothetical protein
MDGELEGRSVGEIDGVSSTTAPKKKRKKAPRGRQISEKQLVDAFSATFAVCGQGNDLDAGGIALMLSIGELEEDVQKMFDSQVLRTSRDDKYSCPKVAPKEFLRWLRLYGKRWFQMRFEILLGEIESRVRDERKAARRLAEYKAAPPSDGSEVN